eukprot:10883715-Heterocapsa_arctica.AAC.1
MRGRGNMPRITARLRSAISGTGQPGIFGMFKKVVARIRHVDMYKKEKGRRMSNYYANCKSNKEKCSPPRVQHAVATIALESIKLSANV